MNATATTTEMTPVVTFQSAPPVAVPCPTWCTEPGGHGYELVGPNDSDARAHGLTAAAEGDWVAWVDMLGYWNGADESYEPAVIQLNQPMVVASRHLEVKSADEARLLARLLLSAADEMDRVNAQATA